MERYLATRLMTLRQRLDAQIARRAELQGELRSIANQLQQEFGVSSIEDADALAARLEMELSAADAELRQLVTQLESELGEVDV